MLIPTDVVAAQEISLTRRPPCRGELDPDGWKGVDIGPETAGTYADVVATASTVLWNGPMGIFEMAPFAAGTRTVAEAVADCSGFTVSAAATAHRRCGRWGSCRRIDHVSTGGGAASS